MSDERARLFVALELPDEVRSALADWCSAVLGRRSGIRPVARDALHLTLCFLGWRAVGEIDALAASCEPVRSCGVVEVGVGDAVWLPARRPRALAVGLLDDDGALRDVQSVLSGSLQAASWYVPESRPFSPHVTVARVAKGARVGREELPPPPALDVRSATVTLFRSRLTAAGARYEPLSRCELESAPPTAACSASMTAGSRTAGSSPST